MCTHIIYTIEYTFLFYLILELTAARINNARCLLSNEHYVCLAIVFQGVTATQVRLVKSMRVARILVITFITT